MTTVRREFLPVARRPTRGCVVSLACIEGQGGTIYDHSGNGQDASLNQGSSGNTATSEAWTSLSAPADGAPIPYVELDGDDDTITIPHSTTIDLSELTVELLFRAPYWPTSRNSHYISKRDSNGDGYSLRDGSNEKLIVNANNTNFIVDGWVSQRNGQELVHAVLTLSNDAQELYVNGSLLKAATGGGAASTSADLTIGGAATGGNHAEIDVFGFNLYDRRLSPLEVKGMWEGARESLGAVQGETRWFDSSWTEQAAVDPDRGTRKLPVLSSPPSNPEPGEEYVDDGTNTSSGNPAKRIYVNGVWVDQN